MRRRFRSEVYARAEPVRARSALVRQSSGLALIAESDHGAKRIILGNLKRTCGPFRDSKPAIWWAVRPLRCRLERQVRRRPRRGRRAHRRLACSVFGLTARRRAENQNGRMAGPVLFAVDERLVESSYVFRSCGPTRNRQGCAVAGGGAQRAASKTFASSAGLTSPICEGARTPALMKEGQDAFDVRGVLEVIDFRN